MAFSAGDTALGWSFAVRVIKVSPEGDIIWLVDCPNTYDWTVNSLCATPDGGALIVGSKFSQTGGLGEGFAIRVNSEGVPLWTTLLNTYFQTYPYHVELQNKAGNSFLVSGAAGSAIWAAWLDTAGNVTKERVFWQDPAHGQFSSASAQQAPDGKIVVSASTLGSGLHWYLGKYDTSAVVVWGAAHSGTCVTPFINSAGHILLGCATTAFDTSYFKKYRGEDGTQLSSLVLANGTAVPKHIYAAVWTENDSAVFAGYALTDRNNYRTDFYFVKMAQVGNPYITAVPALVAEKQPIALYPNPATNYFKISSANPGVITLFNAAGQNVLQQSVQPSEYVDISGLPQGLYMYRFVTSKAVSSGKVVRE